MTELSTARLAAPAVFTAAEGDTAGKFTALVSAYDTKYRIGWSTWHTIEAGSFAAAEGATVPIYAEHGWQSDAAAPIGHGTATETDAGLQIEGELYVAASGDAASVYLALKAGALNEWSIGYRVLATRTDPEDETHMFVTEAELLEASSVLRGANPDTNTLMVASRPNPDDLEKNVAELVDARLEAIAAATSVEHEPVAQTPDAAYAAMSNRSLRETRG